MARRHIEDAEFAKKALGRWMAMSEGERAEAKLPVSQAEFARMWEVTPRTIIRWKQADPLVAAEYEREKKRRQAFASPPAAAPLDGDSEDFAARLEGLDAGAGDPLSDEFQTIRQKLVEGAERGDKGALETYMRYFGKEVLERERAARESSFADMSDEVLVHETLSLVGVERVRAWLEVQGG